MSENQLKLHANAALLTVLAASLRHGMAVTNTYITGSAQRGCRQRRTFSVIAKKQSFGLRECLGNRTTRTKNDLSLSRSLTHALVVRDNCKAPVW